MGLLNSYADLPQWPTEGGLLARLMALQQQQGQYVPGDEIEQKQFAPPTGGSATRPGSLSSLRPQMHA